MIRKYFPKTYFRSIFWTLPRVSKPAVNNSGFLLCLWTWILSIRILQTIPDLCDQNFIFFPKSLLCKCHSQWNLGNRSHPSQLWCQPQTKTPSCHSNGGQLLDHYFLVQFTNRCLTLGGKVKFLLSDPNNSWLRASYCPTFHQPDRLFHVS